MEILLEIFLHLFWFIGWTFPVWVGTNLVYYGTFGYVVCDDEIMAGIIGIVFLLLLSGLLGYFAIRR